MTDMFEELGFGEQRSRWDAERDDDFGDDLENEPDDDGWLEGYDDEEDEW